jgi:hypothetical protein
MLLYICKVKRERKKIKSEEEPMGMLFNTLTMSEQEKIEKYITGTVGAPVASLQHILRFWDRNKTGLFKMFGKQLILEKDICFARDQYQLTRDMEDKFFNYDYDRDPELAQFIQDLRKSCNLIADYENSNFTWQEKDKRGVLRVVESLLSAYDLAANTLSTAAEITIPTTGEVVKVCAGQKITKVIGKFTHIFGLSESGFEKFRIAHSQVLNQKKLTGRLCLSIHPLDYMTMSDNNSGWDSCMSWANEGCYRQGTVEMMNSDMVVVAYLTASEEMPLWWSSNKDDDKYWNNKKWRQLFVINGDIITNVKAYPYRNDELTNICLNWLRELAGADKYHDTIFDWEEDRPVVDGVEHYIDACCDHMYNDFENSNGLFCYIAKGAPKTISFNYSGEAECMNCGDTFEAYGEEVRLLCYTCEPGYSCEECGEPLPDEDYRYWLDDICMCERCYNRYGEEDTITEEWHHRDNMTTVHIGWKDDKGRRGFWEMEHPISVYVNNWKGEYENYITDKIIETASISSPYAVDSFIKLNTMMPNCIYAFDFSSKEELIEYLRTEAEYKGDPIPDWVWE